MPCEGVDACLQSADLATEDGDDLATLLYLLLHRTKGLLLASGIPTELLELLVGGLDIAQELLALLLQTLERP